MEYKNYAQQYYHTIYKDRLKDKTELCPICEMNVHVWNRSKHLKSKKHIMNSMTEEERKNMELIKAKIKVEKKLQEVMKELDSLGNVGA